MLQWCIVEGSFRCSLKLSPKFIEVSPMHLSLQVRLCTRINIWPHFGYCWIFGLGGDQQVFDGAITFEVALYTIPPTDLFNTFAETMGVWYYYMTLGLISLVMGWAPVVCWLLASSITSLGGLVSLFSTLSKAHLGYLQWVGAFLRCCNSF